MSRWALTLVAVLCAASRAPVAYVPLTSDASSASTRVGLVGWVGKVSRGASPITGVRPRSLPVGGLGRGKG